MGSLLKFEEDEEEEEVRYNDQLQERSRSLSSPSSSSSSSYGQKLVPWLSWDEWLFVEHSLFSDSLDSVVSALKRVNSHSEPLNALFLFVSTEKLFPG
jgi:ribosomal biogenesis protein LAS1